MAASAVGMLEYLTTSQFWFESFQNWQSEFLAVAAIVWASVYLRQRGSPESKPVAEPHKRDRQLSRPIPSRRDELVRVGPWPLTSTR